MLECHNIDKIYQTKHEKVEALKNVSLKFDQNELVFILGASGAGKTTLLNILSGLEEPTSGIIKWDKSEIKDKENYRKYKIGFIPQDYKLIENFTVYENVILSLDLQNKNNPKKVFDILDKLNIAHLKDKKVQYLSGGEKARVGISRALVKNPPILLADEIAANLDKETSEKIFAILKEISKEKLVIVVSHDENLASKYADKIITLKDGKIDNIEIKNDKHKYFATSKEKTAKTSFSVLLKYSLKLLLTQKKTRILSLFLITILFTCLGFTLILNNFNLNESHAIALIKNSENEITLLKEKGNTTFNEFFTEEEQSKIEKIIPQDYLLYQYNMYVNDEFYTFKFANNTYVSDFYQYHNWNQEKDYLFIPITDKFNYDYIGKRPTSSNEIMISSFLAMYIKNLGLLTANNEVYYPKTFEELLENNKIKINNDTYYISGIYLLDDEISSKPFLEEEEKEYLLNNLYHIYVNNSFFNQTFSTNNVNYTYIKIALNQIPILTQSSNGISKNEIIINYDYLNELTNNNLYEIYPKEEITKEQAYDYLIKNNLLNQELELYIEDLFGLFKDLKENIKIVGVDEKNILSSELLNKYTFKPFQLRYIKIYPKTLEDVLKILESNMDNVKIKTEYTNDFQNIDKNITSISLIAKNIFYVLLLVTSIIVLFYFYLSFKWNVEFYQVTRYLGMSLKEERKIYLLENSIFSFLVIALNILLLSLLTISGNYILSYKIGYEINLLKNDIWINLILVILIIIYLLLSNFNLHQLKKLKFNIE